MIDASEPNIKPTNMKEIIIIAGLLMSTLWTAAAGGDEICRTSVCEYDLAIRRAQTMVYTDPTSRKVFDVALHGSGHLVVVASNFNSAVDYPDVIGRVVDP